MAGESFAGTSIITPPGSTGGAPRGGYIPVQDIPNVPKTVDMPLAQYQAIPSIRYSYQQPISGFEQRAAALQQPELPGGFAHAGAYISSVAGTGQAAMGAALSKAGTEIGAGLKSISDYMAKASYMALKSKDDYDKDRATEIFTAAQGKIDNYIMEHNLAPEDYHKAVEAVMKDVTPALAKLGHFKGTRDDIAARTTAFGVKEGLRVENKQLVDSRNNDYALGRQKFADALQRGDGVLGTEANDKLLKHNLITEGQYDYNKTLLEQQVNRVQYEKQLNANPQEALDESRRIMNGGEAKSPEWKELAAHPEQLRAVNATAQSMLNKQYVDRTNQFDDDIASGKIPLNKMEEEGKKLGLRPADIATRIASVKKPDPERDAGKINYAMTWVQKYDAMNDLHPKDGKNGMREFGDIANYIKANLPKAEGDELMKELNRKAGVAMENKKEPFAQARLGDLFQQADNMYKAGFFGETGLSTETGKTDLPDPKKRDVYEKTQSRIAQAKDYMRELVKRNPDISETDLIKEWFAQIRPLAAENAGEMVAPPDPHRDERAAPIPKEVLINGSYPSANFLQSPEQVKARQESLDKQLEANMPARPMGGPATSSAGTLGSPSVPFGTSERLSRSLGGVLQGKGDAFIAAGNKYGVDPLLLMAISKFETGNGTSALAKNQNNVTGSYDSSAGGYRKFSSVEESIDFTAKNLKENYLDKGLNTIDAIGAKYAEVGAANDPNRTNASWPQEVKRIYEELKAQGGITSAGGTVDQVGSTKVVNAVDPSAPYMGHPRDVASVDRIIVHGDVGTDVNKLVNYGRQVDPQRGFTPGYHFYIAQNGTIIQGAPVDRITNHTLGENKDSIGIILVGADNGRMPTPVQERAAKQLIATLEQRYGISNRNVYGHGELQPSRRDVREGGNVARDVREGRV